MSLSSTDRGLLTPDNCAVIFIDHQPQMFFGVSKVDREALLNNVLVLAKAAKIFNVPVIVTAVESDGSCGNSLPELLELFPNVTPIESSRRSQARSSGEAFIALGNTRPLEPTKVGCPSASLHCRKCSGGNAVMAGASQASASR